MGSLPISNNPNRKVYFMPFKGTRANPSTIVVTGKFDRSEMDELVRAQCEKRGVSAEQAVEESEKAYEDRTKTAEASKELHARIREQHEFGRLRFGGLKPPTKRKQEDRK